MRSLRTSLIALGLVLNPAIATAQSLVVSSTSLTFTSVADSATPFVPQTIQLTSTGANVPFTVLNSNFYGNGSVSPWVTPTSGMTPATITFAPPVGTALLGTTNYPIGFLMPGSPIETGTQVEVHITFTAPPPPIVGGLADAASFQTGPIAPGEMVTIFGQNIGPLFDMTKVFQVQGPGTFLFLGPDGGTQVTFYDNNGRAIGNDTGAPIVYAAKGQVNVIVPFEVAGESSVNMVLMHDRVAAPAISLRITDTAPAIFSATGTGTGQGAILNADSRLNSMNNPAPKGSIVQIFAEGGGAWAPPSLPDGQLAYGSGTVVPVAPVSLTIGGQPAQILFAGQAPQLVSGVLQINAVIPQSLGPGPQPVVLSVGSNSNSSQGITVAVQ
jgi:uncharacterized protein (TIGR03437 family)